TRFAVMKDITHIFFDLDHTLWDFHANSRETLCELYAEFDLHTLTHADERTFINTYEKINSEKWMLYSKGKIDKKTLRNTRFADSLKRHNVHHSNLAHTLEEEYVKRAPYKPHLMPGALEVVGKLYGKYELHIITNGFLETQSVKMQTTGLMPDCKTVVTSDEDGNNKPDPVILR